MLVCIIPKPTQSRSVHSYRTRSSLAILVAIMIVANGCKRESREPALHEPNYLFAHSMEIAQSTDMQRPLSDTQDLLTDWFGTLDEPKLPPLFQEDDYRELLSLDNLNRAAGLPLDPVEPGDKGLYRQQCSSCHGDSGQGRGRVAASQNPYPREFRLGIFKYKSTRRNAKPLKEDIARSLKQGLTGTQMPLFNKLRDSQIDALVDYVIFLSIRGEFERRLMQSGLNDLDLDKERIYTRTLAETQSKLHETEIEFATNVLTSIADAWIKAPDTVEEFELPDFPIVGHSTDGNPEALAQSIARGKELFVSQISACAKCHGPTGLGEGTQLPDYDDWTKDWTSKIGFDPTKVDDLLPLLARGGMKPQPLKPRNLVEGKFRGGREPMDLYRRIRYGIAGAPMPAAALSSNATEAGLSSDDLWHIVNYILSIANPPEALPDPGLPSTPVPANRVGRL